MQSSKSIKRPLSEPQIQLRQKLISEAENSRYKAVSFKMQDVLVISPFSEECDIFLLMEDEFALFNTGKKSFTELRMSAQEAALKKCGVYTRVTLEMIYKIFAKQSGISPEGNQRLMKLECELTEHFCFPRECGKALFRAAKNKNKKAVIISEWIYPVEVTKNVLENCGYGSFDELITVSDIPESNASSWYDITLEKAGVSAEKLLHIGSSVAFDIELPIVHGSKSLLLAPVNQLMEKSGRLSGYIRKKHIYDYDKPEFLAVHCVLGLYSAYAFDTPQNKTPLSDFCGDRYMLGFAVLGALSLCGDFSSKTEMQELLMKALDSDKTFLDGKADFEKMFEEHFGSFLEKYKAKGCENALEFLEECCGSADREMFRSHFSGERMKKWAASVKEPEIAPFSAGATKKNALYRLADKMFPPGTKVRNIVDGILAKGHKKRR